MRIAIHLDPVKELNIRSEVGLPEPVTVATACDLGGADGLVWRIDPDHEERDLETAKSLRLALRSHLCLEIELNETIIRKVTEIQPDQVTFIPNGKASVDEGLDVSYMAAVLENAIESLRAANIETSLLISPDLAQVKAAREVKADYITLNCASYTLASNTNEALGKLQELESASMAASKLGLRVLVARYLTHRNLPPIASQDIAEEAILDYSFYGRALFHGMEKAIREIRESLRS